MTKEISEGEFCVQTQTINGEGNGFARIGRFGESEKNLQLLEDRVNEARDLFGENSIPYISAKGYYDNRKTEIAEYKKV
jgi:hypothetical protein